MKSKIIPTKNSIPQLPVKIYNYQFIRHNWKLLAPLVTNGYYADRDCMSEYYMHPPPSTELITIESDRYRPISNDDIPETRSSNRKTRKSKEKRTASINHGKVSVFKKKFPSIFFKHTIRCEIVFQMFLLIRSFQKLRHYDTRQTI